MERKIGIGVGSDGGLQPAVFVCGAGEPVAVTQHQRHDLSDLSAIPESMPLTARTVAAPVHERPIRLALKEDAAADDALAYAAVVALVAGLVVALWH